MDLSDALHFLTVVGTGIPAGSQAIIASPFARKIKGFDSERAYELHDTLLHHEGHNAVAAAPTLIAGISAVALLVTDGLDSTAGVFTLVGLLFAAGVGLSTITICAPENDKIREELKSGQVRDPYVERSSLWWRGHYVRVTCGLIAVSSFTVAAIAA